MIARARTKVIKIGAVAIGGDFPIAIQSMTNTDTRNVPATLMQINALAEEGCEIVRVAVPDMAAADALKEIKKNMPPLLPLVADIHFDYRLALAAIENGADKLRLNPGNIGDSAKIKQVAEAAKRRGIPIRIGVNSGSLEKDLIEKYGGVCTDAMIESVRRHICLLENFDFDKIIVSLKASSVPACIEAYEAAARVTDYPLHVGVTEAGTIFAGSIKSAVGIGAILAHGIGDTIRVSLTGDPIEEIRCAKQILQALERRQFGIEIISCPTCGRTEVDLISMANQIEKRCRDIRKNIKVAVMGCVVNGPGEAAVADVGVACGKDAGVLFRKGRVVRTVAGNEIVTALMDEIEKMNEGG